MSLLRRLTKRNLENPKVPISGATLDGWLGRTSTSSAGVVVNEETALRIATVYACVRIISESIGVMPLAVYKRLENGARERDPSHPVYKLLHDTPNPEMTASVFKETLTGHLALWGMAYARIVWGADGMPSALVPLPPDQTTPMRVKDTGQLVYVTKVNGRDIALDDDEVLVLPGLSSDGITGYSPIGLLRQSLGLDQASTEFTSMMFKQGAWLGGVFKTPEALSTEAYERLKSDLKSNHQGVTNAWHPLILEQGLSWEQTGMPKADAAFLDLRKTTKREIVSAYRIPPHMVADLEGGASFASIEQMATEFTRYTLGIYMTKWQQECDRKLLWSGTHFAEFIPDVFLRGDTESRFRAYAIGRNGGWLSINDIRRRENEPPIPAGGDDYLVPLNSMNAGQTNPKVEEASDATTPSEDRTRPAQLRALVEDACNRLRQVELDRVTRATRKGIDADGVGAIYLEHGKRCRDRLVAFLPEGEGRAQACASLDEALAYFLRDREASVRATLESNPEGCATLIATDDDRAHRNFVACVVRAIGAGA